MDDQRKDKKHLISGEASAVGMRPVSAKTTSPCLDPPKGSDGKQQRADSDDDRGCDPGIRGAE